MAKGKTFVEIGKRKFELSNLDKVLFQEDNIVKAEIIQFYISIAPTLLNHLKGRPLTLIRFPDGIDGKQFYQKNRPDWTPDWIESIELGKSGKNQYLMVKEPADLAWLANLACLELHQMHCSSPDFLSPDYIVYDIDPPENYNFKKVVDLALSLRDHLDSFGYSSFVKTTGGKGVHILTPIELGYSFDDVFKVAKDVITPFISRHNNTTLHIKKEARQGRVLIDIYRNRQSQSIISAYSLRGRNGAPVSMPLHWDILTDVDSPLEFDIKTSLELIESSGDCWEGMRSYAVPLHDRNKKSNIIKELPESKFYKSDDELNLYSNKRDFSKSPEPMPKIEDSTGNNFVIHRHNASHLHYDLRLEQNGVLKSWAIPKGMPPMPGVKRFAVSTEDHPFNYLNFEGDIPKGLYGGGNMWIYARGKYKITKEKKDGFYFQLSSPQLTGEFRTHLMKDNEWLLERVDIPQRDWVNSPPPFMQAQSSKQVPTGDNMSYEVKWDGIRCYISVNEGVIKIFSRNLNNITEQFPELVSSIKPFRSESALYDGEIICLDKFGKPEFKAVLKRLMSKNEDTIKRLSERQPALCILFDCLYLDGRVITNEPLVRRRDWLKSTVKKETQFRMSDVLADGPELFDAAKEHGLEGIMAKDNNALYFPGKRNNSWLKVKVRNTIDCKIIGYTQGKGDRTGYFGALHIAEYKNKETLVYRGKVGTGFSEKDQEMIMNNLKELAKSPIPPIENLQIKEESVWFSEFMVCEVEYASLTSNDTFREPVFVKLRSDF